MPQPRTFAVLMGLCLLLPGATLGTARAQIAGRWEVGQPPIHIDLPGQPSRADVAWVQRGGAFFLPNSWKAEGNGVTLELARMLGAEEDPGKLLTAIEAKTGAAGNREQGMVSGRAYIVAQNGNRLVGAIAPEPGVTTSDPWGVVITYTAPGSATFARSLWNSIELDRSAPPRVAMRTLGDSRLVAELPYALAPGMRQAGETQRRYEANWDGITVDATIDMASGPNSRWDTKKTIEDYINNSRSKPGINNFKAEKTRLSIGKLSGDLATLTFKQGTRDYKVWKVATFSGNEGYQFTFTIDPNRTDHVLTVGRALETIRATDTVVTGWKAHSLGSVALESPGTFQQTKDTPDMRVWEYGAGPLVVVVREVKLAGNTGYNPDALANQTTQVIKLLPNMQDARLEGIDKKMVSGIPARLVRYTWRNAGFTNLRSQLFIYGYDHTYTVDVIAAPGYKDAHDRILESASVALRDTSAFRQTIGSKSTSFQFGSTKLTSTAQPVSSKDIKSIQQIIQPMPTGGVIAVVDQMLAEPGKILPRQAVEFYNSFAQELKAGPPQETYDAYLDGGRGFHLRGKATINGVVKDLDVLLLAKHDNVVTFFAVSDPNTEDRRTRDFFLNSARLSSVW